ncbi:guanine nucleotide binding protein, alpha subunit [Zopfochytrium polystomum]|nr:guanine nucleotide binding protein, alpha subunit [Zopfochytrium polystomum]
MACNSAGGGEVQAAALMAKRLSAEIDRQLQADSKAVGHSDSILLLGTGDAGKSTILKQIKLMYGADFTLEEREECRVKLLENLFDTASVTTPNSPGGGTAGGGGGLETATEEMRRAVGALLQFRPPKAKGQGVPGDVVEALQTLWSDMGVQWCLRRGNEYGLLDASDFLITNFRVLCSSTFVPNNSQMLHVRAATTAVTETKLVMNNQRVSVFDVGGQRRLRAKWAPFFDSVSGIIFVISLNCYDQVLEEDGETNRMTDSISAFGCICNHTLLAKIPIILFLNKTDLFAKKVSLSPIKKHFPDYTGEDGSRSAGGAFFLDKFISARRDANKQIFSHFTYATDTNQMRKVLASVTAAILLKGIAMGGLS